MKQYRFILQPYKGINTRYSCPNCKKVHTFSRYIDTENKVSFPSKVGRCNRVNNCGYHFTPKDFFAESPSIVENPDFEIAKKSIQRIEKKPSFINEEVMFSSFQKYENNYLYNYLKKQFGEKPTMDMMKLYNVGTAKYWNGSTVFWQVDENKKIRTGKIMLYDFTTGRRVKKPHSHIHWIHSLMKLDDFVLEQCFFGEHLIDGNNSKQIIAIVESEKTALIASQYIKNYTWIATGGLHNLKNRIKILINHKVILFPDINAFEKWNIIAEYMKVKGMQIEIFDYLEKQADENQRKASYDIADFLIQEKKGAGVLETIIEQNPILKVLIQNLELELV